MQANRLEERWTPTTIQASFAFHPPPCTTKSRHIAVLLPLLSLGWTFVLSLAPERTDAGKKKPTKPVKPCNWILVAFSFRQHDSYVPWGSTSMHAELSLALEQLDADGSPSIYEGEHASHNSVGSDPISLGSITVALAHTPSAELPVATPCTLSPSQIAKVSLMVTISDCPLTNGLFQTRPVANPNDTEAQTELAKQSGDRVLSRSLTTGKLFDARFLSFSTRSPLAISGKVFPTFASLSVLGKHVSLPDSKLGDGWTSALAAVNDCDYADAIYAKEISCPSEYEYEYDSDFEDEDPAEPVSSPPREHSSSAPPKVNDQDSVNCQLEEIIQDSGGLPHLFPMAEADYERTVLVKFAAHRTWLAFLWYCYTGHIEFNGLKSQTTPGTARHGPAHLEDGPPACSPKSMYRLADLVGNKELKDKSLQAIRERMTEDNVVHEMFSIFTSKYPDVRGLQLSVLMEHCRSPEVKRAFLKTMLKYSHMPHAEPVLAAFYDQIIS